MSKDYRRAAKRLKQLLGLSVSPLAITFCADRPEDVPLFDEPMPPQIDDGRTGRVPAGCVFWMKSTERTFATVPEDHGNCSVGSLTHGLISLEQAATCGDVRELVKSGWVSTHLFPDIPRVKERANFVIYGPLAETSVDPDVVFLRLNGKTADAASRRVAGATTPRKTTMPYHRHREGASGNCGERWVHAEPRTHGHV